ncbi:MAG: hypothetical protein R3335_00480 [Anaerolineales bacterium]|nr:hypothetical protein [Anaerolineales bacterium]
MGKPKFDFVVEAVRYAGNGNIAWVRGFERRGPTFSDRVILDRQELIDRLRGGYRVMTGQRVPFMAGTFEVDRRLQLDQVFGNDYVVIDGPGDHRDNLPGVPEI